MQTITWYQVLMKPSWAPPPSVFGPVWSVLYVIILLSFGYVFILYAQRKVPLKVAAPFALNLLCNFLYTPLEFGLRNNLFASIDIVLVLATILWTMVAIFPYKKWVMYAQIPYLLWVAFATVLQLTITYLNF